MVVEMQENNNWIEEKIGGSYALYGAILALRRVGWNSCVCYVISNINTIYYEYSVAPPKSQQPLNKDNDWFDPLLMSSHSILKRVQRICWQRYYLTWHHAHCITRRVSARMKPQDNRKLQRGFDGYNNRRNKKYRCYSASICGCSDHKCNWNDMNENASTIAVIICLSLLCFFLIAAHTAHNTRHVTGIIASPSRIIK